MVATPSENSHFDNDDFTLSYRWQEDGRVMRVDHLWLDSYLRGEDHGSFILETLVRVAYYEGAKVVEVSIGGGEATEAFLEKNGFHIIQRRYYLDEFGVDAVRRV